MDEKENVKYDQTTFYVLFFFAIFAIAGILICSLFGAFYYPKNAFANNYPTVTKVGYSAEYLGTVKRKIPTETSNGGLPAYPKYGYTLSLTDTAKRDVILESWKLCSTTTRIGSDGYPSGTYNSMDADGNLYLNGVSATVPSSKLYKHSASAGMYFGDVADSEPGVIKKITMTSNNAGYNITGLYAPAGEVIKIQMSEADLASTQGLRIFIGQALYNAKANNIWAARNVNRMPVILNTMDVKANTVGSTLENGVFTAYVGSFLGGPIYVQPIRNSSQFSVTISGAVNYSHFILGYTSQEEFEQNKTSSAPFFDLLVWEKGVLHSGPKSQASKFSYDELYNVAVYWDKVAQVSTSMNNSNGIVFIYDPFVAAGAAVAFPSQGAVNCPADWMSNSLNYNSIVTSGAWGNMHEYNHNFQGGWGCGYTGEVTNNALTLVEYSLFTKISSARKLGVSGDGMSGWNCYTSAPWALNLVLSGNINSTNGLAVYSTLNHNFGQDAFIKAKAGGGVSGYLNKWGQVTHQNFTYFATLIKNYTGEVGLSDAVSEAQKNYPMFVPISTIYQTGRSYNYDGEKRYIETMQPYKITYGQNFEVDLNKYTLNSDHQYTSGSIVLPEGFTYKIKRITQPNYGKLTKKSDGVYTYSPDKNHLTSGKIYVTIEISRDGEDWLIDDVDLVLEFEQTHEFNKNILERTIYTYENDKMYSTATEAYTNNYDGYSTKTQEDNLNPTQNSNTDIWVPKPGKNAVMEVKGKLLISSDGNYRLALRGRYHVALYYSTDGKEYALAGEINDPKKANSQYFRLSDANTYVDIKNLKAHDWVYFKAILIVDKEDAYIGVGFSRWTDIYETQTQVEKVLDENGNVVLDEDGNEVTKTTTLNVLVGTEAPTSMEYATGYRADYEVPNNEFNTNYFIQRSYSTTHTTTIDNLGTLVSYKNFTPWDNTTEIDNLFDSDKTNFIHSKNRPNLTENPFEILVDLGENVSANSIKITGEQRSASNIYYPTKYKLYLGTTVDNLELIGEFNASSIDYTNSFEQTTFRYYKLVVTQINGSYLCFRTVEFSQTFKGTLLSPDNNTFTYKGNWNVENTFSTFGHVYSGENATMSFEFYGTQFAIYSLKSSDYQNFKVIIDEQKAINVDLTGNSTKPELAFLSNVLDNKVHTVTIQSKNTFNIDSVSINFSEGTYKKPLSTGAIIAIVLGALLAVGVIVLVVLLLLKKPKNKVENKEKQEKEISEEKKTSNENLAQKQTIKTSSVTKQKTSTAKATSKTDTAINQKTSTKQTPVKKQTSSKQANTKSKKSEQK